MVLYTSARDGDLAQLGERLPYKQRVSGSSPLASTIYIYIALMQVQFDPLAQPVEHLTFNQRVRRSNRLRVTNNASVVQW